MIIKLGKYLSPRFRAVVLSTEYFFRFVQIFIFGFLCWVNSMDFTIGQFSFSHNSFYTLKKQCMAGPEWPFLLHVSKKKRNGRLEVSRVKQLGNKSLIN